MNYLKVYNSLIEKRKQNPPDEYFQIHHIKPRSLFPDLIKDKNNLVKLTYREHYIAHWLLTKIYPVKEMTHAFWRMNCCQNDRYINSCAFQIARKEFNKINKGHIVTEQTRQKISKAHIGRKLSPEHIEIIKKVNMGNKNMLGKHHSIEVRNKMSQSRKGKHHTEQTKHKQSVKKLGQKNPSYGKHWWNNGIKNIYSKECPEGFKRGKIKIYQIGAAKGMKWFNNGIKNVRAKECPEGFKSGRIKIN